MVPSPSEAWWVGEREGLEMCRPLCWGAGARGEPPSPTPSAPPWGWELGPCLEHEAT